MTTRNQDSSSYSTHRSDTRSGHSTATHSSGNYRDRDWGNNSSQSPPQVPSVQHNTGTASRADAPIQQGGHSTAIPGSYPGLSPVATQTTAYQTTTNTGPIRLPPRVDEPLIIPNDSIPNILVFGETGTGKSSLINMIAGRPVAGVSGDALGFTFASKGHGVEINGRVLRLWDTAGLNEGEKGSVPAEKSMQNLQDLVHGLKDGGVSLLVYCIRGTRFRDILQTNYELFSTIICESRVPIVVVVTGLEHAEPMESWWQENGTEFGKRGMQFVGHACVTTTRGKQLKGGGHLFEEEYEESVGLVRDLIEKHIAVRPWVMDEGEWMHNITARLVDYYEKSSRRIPYQNTYQNNSPHAWARDADEGPGVLTELVTLAKGIVGLVGWAFGRRGQGGGGGGSRSRRS